MKGVAKEHLPRKTCAVCGRPFTWRRKWARNWEHVKHCSKRCSSRRSSASRAPGDPRAH